MAYQRTQSIATGSGSGPHSISLKVLRLSRPSLTTAHPLASPPSADNVTTASLPYPSAPADPFPLSPLLTLPPAFGAAYVGETFACTLCVNNERPPSSNITISSVRTSASLQTPSQPGGIELELSPAEGGAASKEEDANADADAAVGAERSVLQPNSTLQRILHHTLREEGPHVLAVTVTYNETTTAANGAPQSGRVRTFRKLYQFVAQPVVGVRSKVGELSSSSTKTTCRKFVIEAQLENLGDQTIVLESVSLDLGKGLESRSLNSWTQEEVGRIGAERESKPILAPQDVQQVAFVVTQIPEEEMEEIGTKVQLAQIKVLWRGPMGEKGDLITGWLSSRAR